MKIKITIMLIVLTGCWSFLPAQYLVNRGADIVISSGSSLVIDGDFTNQLDGSMANSGTVSITGDWINDQTSGNLLIGTSGVVNMIGSGVQNITGSNPTYFYDLNLLNDASLGVSTSVSSVLTLNSTYLACGSSTLVMQFGSSIIGANSSGYVIAGGTGGLLQYVSAGNKSFPVGTISSFVPATLNNSGTADYYTVRVFPDVLSAGTSGGTIPEINDCVNMTWDITENTIGGSDLSVTPFWSAGLEGPNFDRTHCAVGHYTGGSWDPDTEAAAAGANPYSITRSGITTLSAFAVGDLESPMAIPVDIRVASFAFLEGPFSGGSMATDLNGSGYVPLAQPFNEYPWNYAGPENVGSIPAGVVDWVLLELRDAPNAAGATGATTFATKACFMLSDGSIVDLDGSSFPTFSGTLNDDLFVVVYHRNHLPIMSANALVPFAGIYTYDFSSAVGQVYGGVNGHKFLGSGKWGMFSGNGDGDKFIVIADRDNVWDPQSGTNGYKDGDFNMNGEVDNVDKNDHWVENTGEISQVPN
ncbi:MAG: hypothetical protein K9G76_10385 [Bacteroidales bacterium]|nr:hypothetical protein [Bacteroidales bacterium]MCF8405244.1 hypothetical protein [Bacteroidales bacterium]